MIPLSFCMPLFVHICRCPVLSYHAICLCPVLLCCNHVLLSRQPLVCRPIPNTHLSIVLALPILDLAEGSLQWWEQTPRLHRPTQHPEAHQEQPTQAQDNGKCDPVRLDRVSHSEVSRHIFGHECQWKEQNCGFADEQRHPRKAIHSGRLRHGHKLEVLFDMSAIRRCKNKQAALTICTKPSF